MEEKETQKAPAAREPKFTPGPWCWGSGGLRAVEGQLILRRPWNVDPSAPDARLIVSAPDLYEALRAARSELQNYSRTDFGTPNWAVLNTIEEIDAALAKAEGRSAAEPPKEALPDRGTP